MKISSLAALCLIACPQSLQGQDRPADVLFVTGATQSGAGASGAEGDLEWLRNPSARTTLLLGGTATSFSELWWTYATFGGSIKKDRATYSGRVSLGGGHWTQGPFPFQRYVANATAPIAPRVFVEAELQRVSLADVTATVFQAGTMYAAPSGVTVRVAYQQSPSASTRNHGVSIRSDVPIGRVSLMGGLVATSRETTSTVDEALGVTTRIGREYFGGCSMPAGASSLLIAAQLVPQPTSRLVRVTVTLKHPLAPLRRDGGER